MSTDRFVAVLQDPASVRPENIRRPDEARVAAIARRLGARPAGFGPAGDTAVWRSTEVRPRLSALAAAAPVLAAAGPPALDDDLYLIFHQRGSRDEYERPYRERLSRLRAFAAAELLDPGTGIAPLVREVQAILAERTWVMPASDPWLDTFHGRDRSIDLGASARAWALATVGHWFAPRLPAGLIGAIQAACAARVWTPYLETVAAGRGSFEDRWITRGNNWNPVCHGGVVASALALEPDRLHRARIVAAAEANLPFYLAGFSADGACSEGLGYWNYGFSHYVMLAETVRAATGGTVDWLAAPGTAAIAAYPQALWLGGGHFAAHADCPAHARPLRWLQAWLAAREGFPAPAPQGAEEEQPWLHSLPFESLAPRAVQAGPPRLRDHLPDAQVWTWRAGDAAGDGRAAVCIKGGANDDFHNHNDVGSFVYACAGAVPVIDPGAEAYDRDTFGPRRYESAINSSLGHSVPRVDGHLQSAGPAARAQVLAACSDEAQEELGLDLTAAYPAGALRQLRRTFHFDRRSARLTVRDAACFDRPAAFESAVITLEPCAPDGAGGLILGSGPQAVRLRAEADGAALDWQVAPLPRALRDGRVPTRVAAVPRSRSVEFHVTLVLEPA